MHNKDVSDPRISFGRAVRAVRARNGLSQEELADRAGIHRTYIGDVERGKRNIALVNMKRIADSLGITLSSLIAKMERDEKG